MSYTHTSLPMATHHVWTHKHKTLQPVQNNLLSQTRLWGIDYDVTITLLRKCESSSPLQQVHTHTHLCIPRLHFCSVVVIFLECPTHTSNFLTCRCWRCHCCPPAQVEESKEGGSEVHEPCANPLVCQIMWQTGWGGHQKSQTLQGRLFIYLSQAYSWSIHSV